MSSGANVSAAPPHASTSAPTFDAATGHPHAMASSGGCPKPSARLGKIMPEAARKSAGMASASTQPR
jgi:hypothetical protein